MSHVSALLRIEHSILYLALLKTEIWTASRRGIGKVPWVLVA